MKNYYLTKIIFVILIIFSFALLDNNSMLKHEIMYNIISIKSIGEQCNPLDFTVDIPSDSLEHSSCALYVKDKIPKLKKYTLNLYTDKMKIVNVRDSNKRITNNIKYLKAGMVIVCPVTKDKVSDSTQFAFWVKYGHVCYVEHVDYEQEIVLISESSSIKKKLRYRFVKLGNRDECFGGLQAYGFYSPCLDI